jgi:hypothetical protein
MGEREANISQNFTQDLRWILFHVLKPKTDGITGGRSKLCNGNLYNLYSSPNIIRLVKSRRMREMGHAAHRVKMRKSNKTFIGKPKEKRILGSPKHRKEDTSKVNLKNISYEIDLKGF